VWMPLHEAVKRAGSVEALRPHLHDGRILARHKGVYTLPGVTPKMVEHDRIPAGWWRTAHDIEAATGRAQFTGVRVKIGLYEVLAVGIEVERAAVEALWPTPPKVPGRKRGAKPSKVWQQIFDHFDPIVASKGKFPTLGSAATSVETWLENNNKRLHRSTIERGIINYRSDWITA
jgi:hypothetical protein